jgi:hydrogenase nickel incorporation protein HypB
MCGVCGCGDPAAPAAHAHASGAPARHDHAAEDARRVAVEASLLAHNRASAEALAKRLAASGVDAIGLVGGPGAGKTALLEATFERLGRDAAGRELVVEGDCATDHDARRVVARGARAVSVATGTLCHLDAHLVAHALDGVDLAGVARLWIENVGNLVCPAAFPCGERRRVAVVSVTEGDDKPAKYPALFAGVDLLVLAKADLLPHVDFDVARCVAAARAVRPGLPALVVSARTGAGLDAWLAWARGEGG